MSLRRSPGRCLARPELPDDPTGHAVKESALASPDQRRVVLNRTAV